MINLLLGKQWDAYVDVRLTINGLTRDYRLLLDTGAYGVVLWSSLAQFHKVDLSRCFPAPSQTAAGQVSFYRTVASRMEFLGRSPATQLLSPVHANARVVIEYSKASYNNIGFDGLLGVRELGASGMKLTLNYGSQRGSLRV